MISLKVHLGKVNSVGWLARKNDTMGKSKEYCINYIVAQWVKDLALLLLWCGFKPWPGSLCMLWCIQKKKKKIIKREEILLLLLLLLLFYFYFLSFCYFLGRSYGIWRFPGYGSNRSCSHWPTLEPQQHRIRAVSANYTTAQGNARSLTHWAREGTEPTTFDLNDNISLLYFCFIFI